LERFSLWPAQPQRRGRGAGEGYRVAAPTTDGQPGARYRPVEAGHLRSIDTTVGTDQEIAAAGHGDDADDVADPGPASPAGNRRTGRHRWRRHRRRPHQPVTPAVRRGAIPTMRPTRWTADSDPERRRCRRRRRHRRHRRASSRRRRGGGDTGDIVDPDAGARNRTGENGVAEGEDAAVGRHQPVSPLRRGWGHRHDGGVQAGGGQGPVEAGRRRRRRRRRRPRRANSRRRRRWWPRTTSLTTTRIAGSEPK